MKWDVSIAWEKLKNKFDSVSAPIFGSQRRGSFERKKKTLKSD
jgi:hypothetical protein